MSETDALMERLLQQYFYPTAYKVVSDKLCEQGINPKHVTDKDIRKCVNEVIDTRLEYVEAAMPRH
jgi:hypothetical protein